MFPKVKNQFFLAPLLGVTDIAFRVLSRRYGASLCYGEMISAHALNHAGAKELLQFSAEDKPLAIQLVGSEADHLVMAAQKVEDTCDIIDLNMGCPSRTTTNQGAGSALLLDPKKITEIVRKCSSSVSVPVTVKIRAGYACVNAVEIAQICEENGASAITVHGRTKVQGYGLNSNPDIIKEVKAHVSIPVIGNGDIRKPEDAFSMIKKTGCDYVMIGRAAMSNPMIFKQILDYQLQGTYERSDKLRLVHEYLELCAEYNIQFPHVKTNVQNLTFGLKGGAIFRLNINSAQSVNQILKELGIFEKMLESV